MGFSFGGISSDKKAKDLARTQINPLIIDNFDEKIEDYYLFVVDQNPTVDKIILLKKKIKEAGISSYTVVVAVNVIFSYEVEKSLTQFFIANDSKWAKTYVNRKMSNGETKKAKSVMVFGPAMYGLNRSADIMVDNFYASVSVMDRSHYYSPVIETNVFPVDHLSWVFPPIMNSQDGFEVYKTKFLYWQLKKMQRKDAWMPDMRDINIHVIETEEDANKVFEANRGSEIVAWDLETSGFDFFLDQIGCITLCFNGVDGYFIPWKIINKRRLAICLMSCKHRVGANLKFDTKFIWNEDVHGPTVTDGTDILSHAIHSDRFKGLKPLAFFYTIFGGYDDELEVFRKQTGVKNYIKIPVNILSQYATKDAIVTYRAFIALLEHVREIDKRFPNEKLPDWSIERFYKEIMMPVYHDFCEIEFRGTFMNKEILESNKKDLEAKKVIAEQELREIWGVDKNFNVYSTTDVGRLFMKFGWEIPPEINKKGDYSTSDANLIFWEQLGKPGIRKLKELRSLDTMLNMFLGSIDKNGEPTGWSKFIRQHKDGTYRMHPNFIVMGTSTFRCICKDPNLQQFPSGSSLAKYAKQCIGTPDNSLYKIVTFDYSALQTRLAARDTVLNPQGVDPRLYELYKKDSKLGGDLHSSTACATFCEPMHRELLEITDENGKVWLLGFTQKVKIKDRDNRVDPEGISLTQIITGEELVETDVILDYVF